MKDIKKHAQLIGELYKNLAYLESIIDNTENTEKNIQQAENILDMYHQDIVKLDIYIKTRKRKKKRKKEKGKRN
ncbi:hypothetical protein V1503_07970 [Bacillus sp. SCS-151]|uniref:hypothetical protein n=1 Tax=Nanhaiella sioensis TaxID=3115293 RepID=UPI00397C8111